MGGRVAALERNQHGERELLASRSKEAGWSRRSSRTSDQPCCTFSIVATILSMSAEPSSVRRKASHGSSIESRLVAYLQRGEDGRAVRRGERAA